MTSQVAVLAICAQSVAAPLIIGQILNCCRHTPKISMWVFVVEGSFSIPAIDQI